MPTADQPRPGVREPIATFFVATALSSALYWLAQLVPLVQEVLHAAIAVIFLYAPAVAARRSGRAFDYRAAGLRLDPVGKNAAVLGVALLVTWPVFFGAFLAFYSWICQASAPAWARWWAEMFAPLCARWVGLASAELRLPDGFLVLAISQLIVIAIPEELFFRGYLMGRFEERWPSRRRLLGAPVGLPLLLSSALFALGHVLVDFDLGRLAVFFPGLVFGWMRARTGSLAAAAAFHALCNLLSELLHTSFFF